MPKETSIFHRPSREGNASRSRWPRLAVSTAVCLAGLANIACVHAAGLTVNAGDTATWGTPLDLDCDDLVVNGTLDAAGAVFTRVGNVIIGSGGQLSAGGSTIEVTKSWQNSGTFNGAGSTVTVANTCANTSTTFSGDTTFGNLSATVAGHELDFAAGSEETVTGQLTLNGVTLRGTGGTAYLTLQSGGTQSIANVGVSGVDASHGQHLAPSANNVISGGAANNWFVAGPAKPEAGSVAAVPATGPAGLAVLAGLMLAAAGLARRWPGKSRRKSG